MYKSSTKTWFMGGVEYLGDWIHHDESCLVGLKLEKHVATLPVLADKNHVLFRTPCYYNIYPLVYPLVNQHNENHHFSWDNCPILCSSSQTLGHYQRLCPWFCPWISRGDFQWISGGPWRLPRPTSPAMSCTTQRGQNAKVPKRLSINSNLVLRGSTEPGQPGQLKVGDN